MLPCAAVFPDQASPTWLAGEAPSAQVGHMQPLPILEPLSVQCPPGSHIVLSLLKTAKSPLGATGLRGSEASSLSPYPGQSSWMSRTYASPLWTFGPLSWATSKRCHKAVCIPES
jgi:hypothetical protein